jgi:hypothetical protein
MTDDDLQRERQRQLQALSEFARTEEEKKGKTGT